MDARTILTGCPSDYDWRNVKEWGNVKYGRGSVDFAAPNSDGTAVIEWSSDELIEKVLAEEDLSPFDSIRKMTDEDKEKYSIGPQPGNR